MIGQLSEDERRSLEEIGSGPGRRRIPHAHAEKFLSLGLAELVFGYQELTVFGQARRGDDAPLTGAQSRSRRANQVIASARSGARNQSPPGKGGTGRRAMTSQRAVRPRTASAAMRPPITAM